MKFICYPKCSTCKKAGGWLKEHEIQTEYRDISLDNPTYDELKTWVAASGLPLKRFFNTSGLKYRSLDLKNKLPFMSEEEQLRLLSTDGLLVKRPILLGEEFVLVGFREEEWAAALEIR
ncbi:MAG: arsenate reductase family protein [Anaerofustis sp.]